MGNELIDWTVKLCWVALECGAYFSIENPFPAWTWINPPIVELWRHPKVALTTWSMGAYGAVYDKCTGLLHNVPTFHDLGRDTPPGLNPVVLRGKVFCPVEEKMVYRTHGRGLPSGPGVGVWCKGKGGFGVEEIGT